MNRNAWALAAAVALLVFAAVVWPGRYRYDHLKQGPETFPVRIDRITGKAEYFDGAWRSDEQRAVPPVASTTPPRRYSPDNPFATAGQRDTASRRP